MQLLLTNTTTPPTNVSLGLLIAKGKPEVRAMIPAGQTVDILPYMLGVTPGELQLSSDLIHFLMNGSLTLRMVSDTTDNPFLEPTIVMVTSQLVAASAILGMGIAGKTGTIRVAVAANPVVPGAGESMSIDILKNGVTILAAPIVIDATTGAYQGVLGVLDPTNVQVVVGDFFEASLTYVGGAPTPIVRTTVEIGICPG